MIMNHLEIDVYYDRFWKPILRHLIDWRLVWFNGKNYYFLKGDLIYDYKWTHIWWMEGGIIRDTFWRVLAFWEKVTDKPHPFLPYRQFKPIACFVRIEPIRPLTKISSNKPLKKIFWSNYMLIKDHEQ